MSRDTFESDSDSKESRDVRLNSFKSGKNEKTPLLKDLSRSSREFFESESDSKESRDDRLNSPKSGILEFSYFFAFNVAKTQKNTQKLEKRNGKHENVNMPFLEELSRTSRDSFESESDSNKSRHDRLNLPKSGIFENTQILGDLS